jgi:hypothetical protein
VKKEMDEKSSEGIRRRKGSTHDSPFNFLLARSTSLDVGVLRMRSHSHPIIHLALRFVFCDPVFFLNFADELLVLAIDDVYIVIRQFAPTFFD